MSLHHRLSRLIRVGIVVGGVAALSCAAALGLMIHDQKMVTGSYFQAVSLAYQQVTVHSEMRSAVRMYEQNGEAERAEQFFSLEAKDDHINQVLREVLSQEESLLPLVDRVYKGSTQWRITNGEPRIDAVKRHGPTGVPSPLSIQGVEAFVPVSAASDDLIQSILSRRQQAILHLKYSTALVGIVSIISFVGFIFSMFLLNRSLRTWVTVPLEGLVQEVRMVSAGNLQHTIKGCGPEDIMSLGRNIDAMRKRVVAEYTNAVHSQHVAEEARAIIARQSEDLERSNRDLEQFAYVASHDLQEPLRKVSSFCQMIERRYHDQLDERGRQYIDYAVDGAKRMQILINDLLAFSRVGRSGRKWEQVDTSECLNAALHVLEDSIEQSEAQVEFQGLPAIVGDSTLLTQLFQNLVSNAIKFRADAPPKVLLSARLITIDPHRHEWEFSCRDNGIGIEPQYKEKIFAIFQRLHTKNEYSGTGIGLALCKKIVEYHGGQMWLHVEEADVELQQGTEFRWTIPIERSTTLADQTSPSGLPAISADVYPTPLSQPSTAPTTVS